MDTALTKPKKGLSSFTLKYIALAVMVLDHIQYFFEFTGKIPIWFSMIGRLAAPLFLFFVVQGFCLTHNRKKYFLRLLTLSVIMGIIQYLFIATEFKRPDGFYPQNQIIANFVILVVILQGIDWCSNKHWLKGLPTIIIPLALPFIAQWVATICPASITAINVLHFTILPVHAWIFDGGTCYILTGIVLYLTRKNRIAQVIGFVICVFLFDILRVYLLIPGITVQMFFTEAYEWMEVFAAILMLMYNGELGRGSKNFFYYFYPAHVYILFALSWVLYLLMN